MAEDLIGPILTDYVNRAAAAVSPTPGRVIHHGAGAGTPWDECCEGQLWGQLVNVGPITGQNGARGTGVPCGVLFWQATMTLSIIRCVHVVTDQAGAPTPEEMDADGDQMLKDLADLQQVILCHPMTQSIGLWRALGNQGGCGGGEWTFTVRVPVCPCPPEV